MNWETIRRVVRPLLFLAGLGFFVGLVIMNWGEARVLLGPMSWTYFGLSIVFAVLGNIITCAVFQWSLAKYGFDRPLAIVGEMFFLGQLAKYIPGRLWSFVYHTTYFDHPRASVALFGSNLEITAISVWTSASIGGILIGANWTPWAGALIAVVGLLGFMVLIRSGWLPRLMRMLGRKFEAEQDAVDTQVKVLPSAPVMIASYAALVVLYLIANYMLLVYGMHFGWAEATLFVAYFAIAWAVGVLAFVMPAGIGVREAVFVLLATQMSSGHSMQALITIAVVYRFWQLFHDLAAVVIGFGLRRRSS